MGTPEALKPAIELLCNGGQIRNIDVEEDTCHRQLFLAYRRKHA